MSSYLGRCWVQRWECSLSQGPARRMPSSAQNLGRSNIHRKKSFSIFPSRLGMGISKAFFTVYLWHSLWQQNAFNILNDITVLVTFCHRYSIVCSLSMYFIFSQKKQKNNRGVWYLWLIWKVKKFWIQKQILRTRHSHNTFEKIAYWMLCMQFWIKAHVEYFSYAAVM
jgi:hypothetical protein